MALESLPMARFRSAVGIGDLSNVLVKMQDDAEVKVEKGSFSVAMTMADDMSALLSSFCRITVRRKQNLHHQKALLKSVKPQ